MAHKLLLKIDVFSAVPLYQQVADDLAEYISSGRLSAGERLPSIRVMAGQNRVSMDTIRTALYSLNARGLVLSAPGSGYFVNRAFEENHVEKISLRDPDYDFRVIDPNVEIFRGTRWEQSIRSWCNDYLLNPATDFYPAGLPYLRTRIASWLKQTRGISCRASEVFITSGLAHARDLAARLLVGPETRVIAAEPSCAADLISYTARGATVIRVQQDEHGIDLLQLASKHCPDVAHLSPAVSFPSGIKMPLLRRQEILEWAVRNNVTIVEDSSAAGYDYSGEHIPSLYSLANANGSSNSVIYVGSISQHLQPSFQLGFMLVPSKLQAAVLETKWLAERQPSIVTQGLMLTLINDGLFEQHALKTIERVRRNREALLTGLSVWPNEIVSYSPVEAGFQQPVWFVSAIDDKKICRLASEQGIAVSPISQHCSTGFTRSGLCLGFSRTKEEKIGEGLNKLLAIILDCSRNNSSIYWDSALGHPQSGNCIGH